MKKLFSLMAAALVSVAMMAGANDLLWDYTEAAPSANPDNGLTYGSKVADAPSTNNGLNGIKLNSSGYCYFTKAAVAGKLKLSFGPRSGQNKTSLQIHTWEGETASAQTKIAETGELTEYGTMIVELTAEQNNIYITRLLNTETVLQKIEFKELVPRTFVDFKIDFRDNPFSVLLPESGVLPQGVEVDETNYNGLQHGIFGGYISVEVDGPVKFTIGACQYSGSPITIKKDGVDYTTFSNNAACGEQKPNYNQYVTYTYTGEAGTLRFELAGNTYVPYFFAEATEITPCEVIFKDQTGGEIFRIETYEGATLDTLPDNVLLPPAGMDYRFRGWFYTSGKKAQLGDIITGNTTIQAKVTEEEHATVGSVQTYDFSSAIFYPEDHETIETTGGAFHDGTHGWYFGQDGQIKVEIAGKAIVVVTLCTYSETNQVVITDGTDAYAETFDVEKNVTPDGTDFVAQYAGDRNELYIIAPKQYIHKVVVYNVLDFVEKDAKTGYYMVPANDVASFLLALVQANGEGDAKIFLPNGVYDLGETVLTAISKNNISIIGQSMEGTIIKNAPDASTESIDKTATIKINKNVSGTYLQDLTIQNALDYYKNNNGRAVALWDQGTKTVCKNVRLLSYQDTYYSNLQGAVKYFEDCEIHGTVDFICGDGSVYFKNNLLFCEKRNSAGGGSDALTANNGPASDRGYVFEGCTVKSECPTVSMGRAWNNTPSVAFLNTLVDYSAGEFSFLSTRWTTDLMNQGAWPKFGEYNTHLADGTVLTPSSNVVTFKDKSPSTETREIETVLTADAAASYTIDYTLGAWAETAQEEAKQLVAYPIEDDGIYLVELLEDGSCSIVKGSELNAEPILPGISYRRANARGGFGPKDSEPQGVDNTNAETVKPIKIVRDGQVIIVRDGKAYNVYGVAL